jgi:hypothetical protein
MKLLSACNQHTLIPERQISNTVNNQMKILVYNMTYVKAVKGHNHTTFITVSNLQKYFTKYFCRKIVTTL